MRLCLAFLLSILAVAATAQSFTLPGQWSCTVNATSANPSHNYGLEVQVQVSPDRSLFAQGVVIYPQLRNSIQNVRGRGDWTVLPAEDGQGELIKMRMFPQNHPIIAWFIRPAGPGRMYNLFVLPNGQGQVETQCGKFG